MSHSLGNWGTEAQAVFLKCIAKNIWKYFQQQDNQYDAQSK